MITGKNVIKLTSEGMFWANTIAAEMAVEYLYAGRRELVSLEEKTSKIAKRTVHNTCLAHTSLLLPEVPI